MTLYVQEPLVLDFISSRKSVQELVLELNMLMTSVLERCIYQKGGSKTMQFISSRTSVRELHLFKNNLSST